MNNNNSFVRTDLAMEAKEAANIENVRGISYAEETRGKIKVMRMQIATEEGVRIIGKDIGKYVTVESGKPWLMSDGEKAETTDVISAQLREFLGEGQDRSILAVGLGNRDITPDALGPRTIDGLIVTRHVKTSDRLLFDKIGQEEISALTPGVVGQTGIETFELIKGAVKTVAPDAVIVIDALAARSVDRLVTTIQLSDAGIAPGSGIGNKRRRIDTASLGVPVIAIGVPTVVDSSTLVYDALERAGIEEIDDTLRAVLENGKSFFVSLKESDVAVAEMAKLISEALNKAFCRL